MGLNAYIHGRHVWSGDTYYCSIRDRTSKVGVELPFRRDTGTRRVIDKRSMCGRGYHSKLAMGILTLEIYSKPLMGIRPSGIIYILLLWGLRVEVVAGSFWGMLRLTLWNHHNINRPRQATIWSYISYVEGFVVLMLLWKKHYVSIDVKSTEPKGFPLVSRNTHTSWCYVCFCRVVLFIPIWKYHEYVSWVRPVDD